MAATEAGEEEGFAPLYGPGGLGGFCLSPSEWAALRQGAARRMSLALLEEMGTAGGEAGEVGVGSDEWGVGRLGCPWGIWDERPNDWWHPLAGRICREVWARYEARLAKAGAGGGETE
jgi:hypothetical protein